MEKRERKGEIMCLRKGNAPFGSAPKVCHNFHSNQSRRRFLGKDGTALTVVIHTHQSHIHTSVAHKHIAIFCTYSCLSDNNKTNKENQSKQIHVHQR